MAAGGSAQDVRLETDDGACYRKVRSVAEDLFEGDSRFEARQGRADAVMDALAEGEIALLLSSHIERVRIDPYAFVTIPRGVQEEDLAPLRHGRVMEDDVLSGRPMQILDRSLVP